ncbi:MAG: hypothetical protein AAF711_06910 [Planctomycetota bacterium]
MSEFIDAILSPVNFGLSIMLVCVVGYWLLVIFGALAPDSLDFDFDLDGEADLEIDADHGPGGLGLAKFFNVGEVPLMVLLSVFLGVLWLSGVLLHPYIGAWGLLVQIALLVPMAIGSLFATKLLTQPFKTLLKQLRSGEDAGKIELIGQRCRIISAVANTNTGQAEVQTAGAPLRLNVRTADAAQELQKGDEAVIVIDRNQQGIYIVRGF